MEKIYRTKNSLTVIQWRKKYRAFGLMVEKSPIWLHRKIVFTFQLELLIASLWFTLYERKPNNTTRQ